MKVQLELNKLLLFTMVMDRLMDEVRQDSMNSDISR